MPRYIVDSYLYRAIGADIDGRCGKCIQSHSDCMYHSLSRMDICGIIEDAPTIDAVEVVRCKDCKYAHTITFENGVHCLSCNYQNAHGMLVENHGFCYWGDRRDDAEIH